MRGVIPAILALGGTLLLDGCATQPRSGLSPAEAQRVQQSLVRRSLGLPRELEEQILALDPEQVTAPEVEDVLSRAPAPRIINIHGGIHPVQYWMVSFSDFLIGMGYPGSSLAHPGDRTYSFSCYESSRKIAGVIAWYYEQEGFRPMIVGHSQGGMQAVKVLHRLAGGAAHPLRVWNPLTWKKEPRHEFVDPFTGERRPVTDLRLPYATAVVAGGLARFLPNQWDMAWRLRTIPDSVEEFTGFSKGRDILGGDFMGYGPVNLYQASGQARVRNVWLPSEYRHGSIPDTRHLLRDPEIKDWISRYRPSGQPVDRPAVGAKLAGDTRHILWAAEVWYSLKKHWVLELQHRIRSERALTHDH